MAVHITTATHRDRAYRAHNPTGVALAAERAESARVRRLGSREAQDAYLAAESIRDNGTRDDPPYFLAVAIAAGVGIPDDPGDGTSWYPIEDDDLGAPVRYNTAVDTLTLAEAALEAGCKPASFRVYAHRGQIALVKRGRDLHVTRAELDRFLATRRSPGRPKKAPITP